MTHFLYVNTLQSYLTLFLNFKHLILLPKLVIVAILFFISIAILSQSIKPLYFAYKFYKINCSKIFIQSIRIFINMYLITLMINF